MRKLKKRCINNAFTFMIIPETAARSWRFNVTGKTVGIVTTIGGILALIFLLVTVSYFVNWTNFKDVNAIKEDNQKKQEDINSLRNEMKTIIQRQDQVNLRQNQIKKIMGIKTESSNNPSRGGQGGKDIQTRSYETDVYTLSKAENIGAELARQNKELDEITAQANKNTGYLRSLPNQWPVRGEITSDFGWRNSPFKRAKEGYHDGIDIANKSGTEIVAAGDGTVTYAGWQVAYGRTVLIDHGFGLVSKYGHNSVLLVKKGDVVKKGQVIARMGSTGWSTGPHLHFTIYKNGIAQDPLIYLP